MARKEKHKPGKAKTFSPQAMDVAILAENAAAALAGENFRQAIELYRELLKREQRSEWRAAQAHAYAGRAAELAGKGMLKEAMTVWRNRAEVCGLSLLSGPYLAWLLQSGEPGEVIRHYRQRLAKGETGAGADDLLELEAQLAPHLLALDDAALADFPADSSLLRHCAAARAALRAYAQGDVALPERIKDISFRSPYRDLGQVLKALDLLAENSTAALTLLQRVPTDSPFAGFAAAVRSATMPVGGAWLRAVFALHAAERRLALSFKGVPLHWESILGEIARLGEFPAAANLFEILVRHRKSLPDQEVRALCTHLAIHCQYGVRAYQQAFGNLPRFTEIRLHALQAEQHGMSGSAVDAWLDAKSVLQQGSKVKDDGLRLALILRHMAEQEMRMEGDAEISEEALEWLAESRLHDPDDLQTILVLLVSYRRQGKLKEARSLLEDALRLHSGQASLLLEAVEIALAGNAFKKAVSFARRVLDLDPINPRVRALLGGAHLSHARKQIKAIKFEAALKELNEAEEWLRSPRDRGVLQLLRAIISHDRGDSTASRDWLTQAVTLLGGELLAYVQLGLEMEFFHRDSIVMAKQLCLPMPTLIRAEELMDLMAMLETSHPDRLLLRRVLSPLIQLLRKAAALKLPEAHSQRICETWSRLEQPETLTLFAEAARKRHPRNPVFIFHAIDARFGRSPLSMRETEFDQLEFARDLAAQQGDQRTVVRIDRLLGPPPGFFDGDEDDLPFDFPEPSLGGSPVGAEERDLFERVLQELGEDAFLDLIEKSMGKKLFREIQKGVRKDLLVPMLVEILGIESQARPITPPSEPKKRKPTPSMPGQKDIFDD